MAKKNGNASIAYKSYPFRHQRDPVLDTIESWIADSGKSLTEINAGSTVAVATMQNWKRTAWGSKKRKRPPTRKPQFCTIAAVAKALGKKTIPL
jgi:hypothetical protein